MKAAEFCGVSPSKFDDMVDDGRMPQPVKIDARRVWDVYELDTAFSDLPRSDQGEDDVWGKPEV